MSDPVPSPPDPELHQRRREILRGLTQINSLNLGVVILVAALAMIAILLAFKSREDARKVWTASVTQARASRFGGEIGWKSNALTTLARASEVRPSLALRNEAIAALSTLDVDLVGPWLRTGPGYNGLFFSPDLHYTALSKADGSIELVATQTGETVQKLKAQDPVAVMSIDHSSKFLGARGRSGRLMVWSIESGAQILSIAPAANQRTFDTLAFTSDSVVIAVASGKLEFYSLRSGKSQPERTVPIDGDYGLLVSDVTGKTLAGILTNRVEILDADSGHVIMQMKSPDDVTSMALSRDAKYFAAGTASAKVLLWRTVDGEMQELAGHEGVVFRAAFDPEGKWLATCAYGGTARLWEVSSGQRLLSTESLFIEAFGPGDSVGCTRVEAGFAIGRVTDAGIARTIHLPNQEPDKSVYFVSFVAPDKVIGVRNDKAQIVDLSSGATIGEMPGERMRGAVFNARDRSIYTVSAKGLQRWPMESPDRLASGPPESIALEKGRPNEHERFSPDGTEAVLRIGFQGAALFDLVSRKTLAFFPVPNVGSLAFSPDKQIIVSGTFHGEGTKIWKRDGTLIKNIGGRDASPVFSPDGKWLATVASDLCIVYDAKNWEPKLRFPMNSASGLPGIGAFSPNSELLAFTVMRRGVRLVNVLTGMEVASLSAPEPQQISWIDFSPDGERLVAGTARANLEVWEVGALRKQLVALKLDWRDEGRVATASPGALVFKWVPAIAGVTLAAALGFGVISWVRHRRFVGLYHQIEMQIEQRSAELAAAQNELFQSQKMRALGTLAAGIAHDFNNLLSIIRMSNQLTTEATTHNPDAQENARIIERAVSQGKNVVRSMLNYSRNASDQEEFSVAELVEQTVGLLRQQFLAKVEVTLETTGAVERIVGVPNRVEQALLNLIVNAVEAIKGSGKLRLTTRQIESVEGDLALRPAPAASYVEVAIADSGPGMSAETLARIFEPFFTTKTIGRERGTGLGLSLVYGICKQEGIGIEVKSTVGVGTEFRLLLPVRREKSGMLSRDASATLPA